jgi:trehalose/maltose hydrolase-like predicted phosphorylase
MKVVITLSPRDYDGVLFDLDGVLTRTASVHAAAWKKLFDAFLQQRATQTAYPDSATPGIANNAYTNIMAVWVLCRALEVLELLSDMRRAELTTRLGISAEEIARWSEISSRMVVPFHDDGIISQFEGYDNLRELDWEGYRARYGNIQRLDLILEAEGDSANRYKLAKQADVMMLFYLFSSEELRQLFERLGYPFEYETIPRRAVVSHDLGSPLSSFLFTPPGRSRGGVAP